MLIPRNPADVAELTEKQAKTLLIVLLTKLDDLSDEDFFGTEGWRHYFGLGD